MPTQAWIAIAVVAVLIITVLIVGLVRYRSRTISLEPRPDTPIDRSGGYQAGTGFSFSEGTRDGATATLDPSGLPGVGDDAAVKTVHAALDAGITTFDTADTYANTAAEVVLGKLCSRVLEAGVGLDALEEALIQHAVRESGGNLSGAARLLRITRPQLNYRLKKQNNAP